MNVNSVSIYQLAKKKKKKSFCATAFCMVEVTQLTKLINHLIACQISKCAHANQQIFSVYQMYLIPSSNPAHLHAKAYT